MASNIDSESKYGANLKSSGGSLKYYPVRKNWSRIKSLLKNKELQKILVRDFNKFTYGRWREPFKPGMVPIDFESCDWYSDHRGRWPEFWDYVKWSACHWLVNFNLKLALLIAPNRPWRILESKKHSTVWDGEKTLFDMNFLALGVPPKEAFSLAYTKGRHHTVGEPISVFYAEHYKREGNKLRQVRPKKSLKRESLGATVRCKSAAKVR